MAQCKYYFESMRPFFIFTFVFALVVFFAVTAISPLAAAWIPEANPSSTIGLEFVVPIAGSAAPGGLEGSTVFVTAIYNNTKVEFDYNNDGVADNITYINKSQTIGGTAGKNDLPASTWIRASKPVLVWGTVSIYVTQAMYYIDSSTGGWNYWGNSGYNIPKASELSTDYYVPTNLSNNNNVYIAAAYSNTTLWIDQENDGINDTVNCAAGCTSISASGSKISLGVSYQFGYLPTSLFAGAHIHADKPIVVVQRARIGLTWWGYAIPKPGTDYYVPIAGGDAGGPTGSTIYVTALNTSTKIDFDTNADGIYDRSIIVGKSNVSTWPDLPASSHIHADKPIVVVQRLDGSGSWGYDVPKADNLGTDYYVPLNLTGNVVYVTAAYSNTTLQIDNDNNGVYEYSTSLVPGATYTNTTLFAGAHLHADKPIVVVQKALQGTWNWNDGYIRIWGYKIDPVAIEAAQYTDTPQVAPNGNFRVYTKIVNPTDTPIYNITANLSWPVNFTGSPSQTGVLVAGYLYDLTNDSFIQGYVASPPPTPDCFTNPTICTIRMNRTHFTPNLPSPLGRDQYLILNYTLTASTTPLGVYLFPQASIGFDAETWVW